MLFSEPKIPQSHCWRLRSWKARRFSALQRAENSSIPVRLCRQTLDGKFQCSSASRKFLNLRLARRRSAHAQLFQCSSASRKFLNGEVAVRVDVVERCFSALQRAENSSIQQRQRLASRVARFSALQRAENSSMSAFSMMSRRFASFQCSSASRKFLNRSFAASRSICVSSFSALQRAENSSILETWANVAPARCFSALQRAENSSIPTLAPASIHNFRPR